jgi:hypothetical protein
VNTPIPTEVELVFELMPCQAERAAQEPGFTPHPCSYFHDQWGTYHTFDYEQPGPPKPGTVTEADYLGRARLLPEMLTGCRKAPIMAVGINPNLPGWWPPTRGSLNPLFDDYRQYAHYFRYRAGTKPQLSSDDYTTFGGSAMDDPLTSETALNVPPDAAGHHPVKVQWVQQKMYAAYQSLLDDLALQMNWPAGNLRVGEDLSFGNMVACPSAKWITAKDPQNPTIPPMTTAERDGIVSECFHLRKYMPRQLFQSLPAIVFVFGQNTANAFLGEFHGKFSSGNPQPNEPVTSLMRKEVSLRFGEAPDGTVLEARVLFAPHPTGDEAKWLQARSTVVSQLVHAAQQGRLKVNPGTGHLARPAGSCVFCTMLDIGPCDYLAELTPLTNPPGTILSQAFANLAADKPAQTHLLNKFLDALKPAPDAWAFTDDPHGKYHK